MKTTDKIRAQLQANPIMLYMKGTPDEPKCGFSGKAATALNSTGISYAFVDVLNAPLVKQALPDVSEFLPFRSCLLQVN